MKISARNKLKLKILAEYDTIKNFCIEIGYSKSYINCIFSGESLGSKDFWGKIKKYLNIPDEELWSYQRREL